MSVMTSYAACMRKLDPDSSKPPSQQIADAIREAIRSGELQPGARIPGRAKLQEHFGVAVATINSAVNTLKRGGILVSRQGSGVFVRTDAGQQYVRADTADHTETKVTLAVLAGIDARLARIEKHLGITDTEG